MSAAAPLSNSVLNVAVRLQEVCVANGWKFCFIGGLAVQLWSEPRVTDDVDLTLLTGFGGEEPFIDTLLALDWVRPRRVDARAFALARRVLLIESDSGVGIDVALAAFPFEELATERARDWDLLPGIRLRLCTPEDLIVFKVFAARSLDWRDVEMLIERQGDGQLDWDYVREQLTPLAALKEEPELVDQLDALREKIRSRPRRGDL